MKLALASILIVFFLSTSGLVYFFHNTTKYRKELELIRHENGSLRTQLQVALKKYHRINKRISTLNAIDIAEYYSLINKKEKYEKADLLLEKIIKIFLADLSIRLTSKKLHVHNEIKNNIASMNHNDLNTMIGQSPATVDDQSTKIYSEKEINDFLKTVKKHDILQELKKSKPFDIVGAKLKSLIGKYAGKIQMKDKPDSESSLSVFFHSLWITNNQLMGKWDIRLSLPEEYFTYSTEDSEQGAKNLLYHFGDRSRSLLLNIFNNHIFQLYYLNHLDQFVGNYYKRNKFVNFEYMGTIQLKRVTQLD